MTEQELQQIIQQGEGFFTEFKRNVNSDIKKELVAFANASGGNIFIGVDDDGTIPGISVTNELLSKIQTSASDCDPSVAIEIEKVGTNVLQVKVPEGTAKPYRCTNGFYLRQGANAQKLTTDAITEFLEKEGRVRFDEQIRQDAPSANAVGLVQWERFAKLSKLDDSLSPGTALKSLGVIKEIDGTDYFTNTGILVFANDPKPWLPQNSVACVLYKGTEKVTILDQKEFDQDVISNINAAIQFVERHINIAAKIEGTQRVDVWEIPEVALREAIVNAVVHRDYLEKGARVMLEVFDDRVVISNPGGLPKGLAEKDFGKYSLCRNSVLAGLLLRAGYIEKLGTGVHRIDKVLADAGLPKANFAFDTFFSVVFSRHKDGGQKSGQKSGQKGGQKLTARQQEVYNLIAAEPTVTRIVLADTLNINPSAVQKHIEKLKAKGIIERVGGDKGGYWKTKGE